MFVKDKATNIMRHNKNILGVLPGEDVAFRMEDDLFGKIVQFVAVFRGPCPRAGPRPALHMPRNAADILTSWRGNIELGAGTPTPATRSGRQVQPFVDAHANLVRFECRPVKLDFLPGRAYHRAKGPPAGAAAFLGETRFLAVRASWLYV